MKKLIVGGLLTAVVITFALYVWSAISTKMLEKRINDIKSDYYTRLVGIRARVRTPRKVAHGTPESGNAWDYYRKAIARFKEMTDEEKDAFDTLSSKSRENETADQKVARSKRAAEIVEKYKGIFELIHKGTLQMTADAGFKYEEGAYIQIPETTDSLSISKLIPVEASVLESKGETGKAIELYLDGIRFGQDLIQGILICDLVSISDTKIQVSGLSGLLNKETVDKTILNKLYNETGVLLESQPSIVDAMNDEVVFADATLIEIIDDPNKTNEQEKRIFKKCFADYISDYVKAVSKLQSQSHNYAAFNQTWRKEYDSMYEAMTKENNIVTALLIPALDSVFSHILESNASLQELKIATALKLYSQDNGRAPNQLGELVRSGYMNSLPSDPFTGEPFKYSISNDGREVTIYSVGKNLRDDGGKGGKYEEDDITFILKLY